MQNAQARMGIYDRDYMKRADGTPRTLSAFPLVVIGVIAVTLFGLLIAFCQSGHQNQSAVETPAKSSLRVNINTATMEELQSIPNIGPARARSIVNRRPYASVEDLVSKGALGQKTAAVVAPFVKTDGVNERLKPAVRQ